MRTRDTLRAAKALGAAAGKNAASWCIDGNTTDATKAAILKGIDDGDPMILDRFNSPSLCGQYADGPTPRSLAENIGIDPDDDHRLDAACTAWEDAASDAFWTTLANDCKP